MIRRDECQQRTTDDLGRRQQVQALVQADHRSRLPVAAQYSHDNIRRPIIEAVMIGAGDQQGISFDSRGIEMAN
jgi:hypothetical protein